jgi:cellobiose-specific phosphotransferase system component IIB
MVSAKQTPLNDVQMTLLRLFSRPMTDHQMREVKDLLMAYYSKMLQQEVDKAIAEKGITDEQIDAVLYKQQRTSSK